jgi:uncharacterized membrane protein
VAEGAPAQYRSLTEGIGFSWRLVWKQPICILVFFVASLCGQALALPGAFLGLVVEHSGGRDAEVAGIVIRVAANLANIPVAVFFAMGSVRYALRLVRGEPAGFQDLFSWGPYFAYLGATLLVALGTWFGLLFCIVPGIFLMICWLFTGMAILDRGMGPVEAMGHSWNLSRGHRWDLLLFLLLLLGVNILGLLACCVGVFVTSAMSYLAWAWVYLRLTGQETTAP